MNSSKYVLFPVLTLLLANACAMPQASNPLVKPSASPTTAASAEPDAEDDDLNKAVTSTPAISTEADIDGWIQKIKDGYDKVVLPPVDRTPVSSDLVQALKAYPPQPTSPPPSPQTPQEFFKPYQNLTGALYFNLNPGITEADLGRPLEEITTVGNPDRTAQLVQALNRFTIQYSGGPQADGTYGFPSEPPPPPGTTVPQPILLTLSFTWLGKYKLSDPFPSRSLFLNGGSIRSSKISDSQLTGIGRATYLYVEGSKTLTPPYSSQIMTDEVPVIAFTTKGQGAKIACKNAYIEKVSPMPNNFPYDSQKKEIKLTDLYSKGCSFNEAFVAKSAANDPNYDKKPTLSVDGFYSVDGIFPPAMTAKLMGNSADSSRGPVFINPRLLTSGYPWILVSSQLPYARFKYQDMNLEFTDSDARSTTFDGTIKKIKASKTNLSGSQFPFGSGELELTDSNLSSARFASKSLIGKITAAGADLTGTQLSQVNIGKGQVFKCNFKNTNLSSASLNSISFDQTDLTGADFSNARLFDVNFKGALNLERAKFTGATLNQVTWSDGRACKPGSVGACQ